MFPNEFNTRKARRKLSSDGLKDTAVKATELLVRKRCGHQIFEQLSERNILRTLPRDQIADQNITNLFTEGTESELSRSFIAIFPSGYVFTETGLATTRNFEIIEESAGNPDYAEQAMMEMLSRELFFGTLSVGGLFRGEESKTPPELDTVTPLIPRYPMNYYHWMIETVPKIRYIRAFEKKANTNVTLLLQTDAPEFVTETLELLGWPCSKVVRANEPMYRVRNLIIPPFPEKTKAEFGWLRGEILGGLVDHSGVTHKGKFKSNRVYVSRANAITRRVTNEDAVMNVLSKYGFERYLLENRSLAENARLFSQADVVVGPHGAGLTDIVFTENCSLVELFGARLNQAYENLSEELGVEYVPLYCEDDSSDIVVDTDELEARVAEIVE